MNIETMEWSAEDLTRAVVEGLPGGGSSMVTPLNMSAVEFFWAGTKFRAISQRLAACSVCCEVFTEDTAVWATTGGSDFIAQILHGWLIRRGRPEMEVEQDEAVRKLTGFVENLIERREQTPDEDSRAIQRDLMENVKIDEPTIQVVVPIRNPSFIVILPMEREEDLETVGNLSSIIPGCAFHRVV